MRELDACGIGFVADAQGRASRAIVAAALHGLACVKHRGAAAADGLTSDGCGVLTPIPAALFGEGNGVIALFVRGADATTLVEDACAAEGVEVVDWRKPETDDTVLGHMAADTRPEILQAVIAPPTDSPHSDEVTAYRIRRHLTDVDGLYVVSCSYRTVVYKSLAAADHLADFYRDLADPRYEAAFTIFHQRFSTNTLPTWERAQPFRSLCHNGEINAIQGNAQPHAGPVHPGHRRGRPRSRTPVLAGPRRQHVGLGQVGRGPRAPHPGRAGHPPRRGHARARGLGARPSTSIPRSAASTGITPRSWSPGTARPA